MQGLSTQACKAFMVLEVFKSKDEAWQLDRDKWSSQVSSLSTLQFPSPLTIDLPCVLLHFGEVEESSSRPEVEGIQSLNLVGYIIFVLNLCPKLMNATERHDCKNNCIAHKINKHISSSRIKIRVSPLL
jgi:hypothetical protein